VFVTPSPCPTGGLLLVVECVVVQGESAVCSMAEERIVAGMCHLKAASKTADFVVLRVYGCWASRAAHTAAKPSRPCAEPVPRKQGVPTCRDVALQCGE
jgi:hypothetical protein